MAMDWRNDLPIWHKDATCNCCDNWGGAFRVDGEFLCPNCVWLSEGFAPEWEHICRKHKPIFLRGLHKKLDLLHDLLERILTLEYINMATQAEAAQELRKANDSLTKIGGETTTLLEKVKALEDAAANAGNVGPELQAAIDAVVSQAQAVDDLVPDVIPAPAPGTP